MVFGAVYVLLIYTIVGSTDVCHSGSCYMKDQYCTLTLISSNCYVCSCGTKDGSCEEICEPDTNYPRFDFSDDDSRYYMGRDLCYCDQTCTWYKDCCDDFREFCPEYLPSSGPVYSPTIQPTYSPTLGPISPTKQPSLSPTSKPTSISPTSKPTSTSEPTYRPTSEPTYKTKKPSLKPTSTPTLFPTFQLSPGKRRYVTPFLMAFEEPLTQSELEALAVVICSYCFALPRDRCAYAGTELSKTYLYKITSYSIEAFAVMFSTSLYTDGVIARANYGMEMEKDALGFSEPPTLSFVVFGKTVLVDEEGNESYCVMIITILGVCTCILVCVVALLMMMRNRNKGANTVYGGMELQPPTYNAAMEEVVTTGPKEGNLMWESETRAV